MTKTNSKADDNFRLTAVRASVQDWMREKERRVKDHFHLPSPPLPARSCVQRHSQRSGGTGHLRPADTDKALLATGGMLQWLSIILADWWAPTAVHRPLCYIAVTGLLATKLRGSDLRRLGRGGGSDVDWPGLSMCCKLNRLFMLRSLHRITAAPLYCDYFSFLTYVVS